MLRLNEGRACLRAVGTWPYGRWVPCRVFCATARNQLAHQGRILWHSLLL